MSITTNKPNIDLKTQRYDRQLRLWASSGQAALESANVCLLNATATGCEVLKNLILPGIGNVTIVDDKLVDKHDIQSNFFLEPSDINSPKAQSVVHLLKELNEAVETHFVQKSPHDLLQHDPSFFSSFSLIVATNMHQTDISRLATLCEESNKILITVSCKGLFGLFRIQAPDHTIIETHPENVIDLRLTQPFPQLMEYVKTFDLDALDQTDHAHVPFIVILLIFVEKWKAEHDGKLPQSYAERNELKSLVQANMRTVDEENFEEAISNIWRLSGGNNISSDVRSIFASDACENLNGQSTYFWIIARAIRDFMNNEGQGQLPLSGKLPDMKSDTKNYVGLQNAYRQKALEDLKNVTLRVDALLNKLDIPKDLLPNDAIDTFCKNAGHVKLIQFRSINEEIQQPRATKIENLLSTDDNMTYYIIFQAADHFFTQHQRYPGEMMETNDEQEVKLLKEQVIKTLQTMGINDCGLVDTILTKPMTNYIRFRNQETANMAALMGGLVAQEAIKLITRQYIPINNTCLFNGIASTSSVVDL
ncbi:ThiF family protein [Halteromyces radiatus]|uniref:ThiF family protein n=1 Tax=Halteromyces radiatus TaxID=101107 RepID=UPI0022206BA0|nr:ThiF family protein [Halteromyces radiatus]KAI8092661.1 ThiF family protein [Halteromyces radiatus]